MTKYPYLVIRAKALTRRENPRVYRCETRDIADTKAEELKRRSGGEEFVVYGPIEGAGPKIAAAPIPLKG